MKDWNELRNRAYKNACEHGFHDEQWSDEHLLCLVVCELMEAVQADRKGKRADKVAFEYSVKDYESYCSGVIMNKTFMMKYEHFVKNTVEDELSDACIRLLDLGGVKKTDIRTDGYPDMVSGKETFTWNVYRITRILTDNALPVYDRINHALSQISALADILNIDLMWFIETKMKYNEMRPYKHGCKY